MYNIDETNFYQHVGATGVNVTREVGLETIIPTLYTYITSPDEGIRINIIDQDNTLLQVFDSEIEEIVEKAGNMGKGVTLSDKEAKILERYNNKNKKVYMFGAPWRGNTNYAIDRINAYIYGYSVNIPGSTITLAYDATEYTNLMSLIESENTRFNESYVEYQASGQIYWNENRDESLVVIDGATKNIINYQKKKE